MILLRFAKSIVAEGSPGDVWIQRLRSGHEFFVRHEEENKGCAAALLKTAHVAIGLFAYPTFLFLALAYNILSIPYTGRIPKLWVT